MQMEYQIQLDETLRGNISADVIANAVSDFEETVIQNLSTEKSKMLVRKALQLCVELHLDQEARPDGTPYPLHPISVAKKIAQMAPQDAELICAALLHDSIEDQAEKIARKYDLEFSDHTVKEVALKALAEEFSERTAHTISLLTNPDFNAEADQLIKDGSELSKPDLKNLLYKDHLISLATEDPKVFAIKLSDFSENALCISSVEDQKRYIKLRNKYQPCIQEIIDVLEEWGNASGLKKHISSFFLEAYKEGYQREYLSVR